MYELKVVRERCPGTAPQGAPLATPEAVFQAFRSHFAPLDREQFVVAILDAKGRSIGFHVVSMGTLTASLVHPREVFKAVLLANAASIVLLHNHPSGDPTPSAEDTAITERLVLCGQLLGVAVIDHVVFGDDGFASFAQLGLMPKP